MASSDGGMNLQFTGDPSRHRGAEGGPQVLIKSSGNRGRREAPEFRRHTNHRAIANRFCLPKKVRR